MPATIHTGDALAILKTLPSNTYDAMLTDPPYGIKFMGKEWDKGVPSADVWREALRVLKPGAYALVACGTRTQHRMVTNLEDAGFEVRDVIAWLYGSGFPKSHDVSKHVDRNLGATRERKRRANYTAAAIEAGRTTRRPSQNHMKTVSCQPHTAAVDINSTRRSTRTPPAWHGFGTASSPHGTDASPQTTQGTIAQNVSRRGALNIDGASVFGSDATAVWRTPSIGQRTKNHNTVCR
jgi:hypothetical protein